MSKNFRVDGDKKIKLKDFNTNDDGNYTKAEGVILLDKLKNELAILQERLYAENKYAVLIIFQAMDAAGKDSAIKHIMSGINPQGCQVYSFKQPSSEEYEHDFLWRHYKALPEKGRIGIHNRSHYENVLVCKVHPELVKKEGFLNKPGNEFWKSRYESICEMEKHLAANRTVVIKFFLNVSKDEQKERFLKRINDPEKNWKFSAFDLEERKLWDDYMKAYETAINETATKHAPWHIIPADRKWFARVAVCQAIVDRLKSLDLKLPELNAEQKGELEASRAALQSE